MRVIRKCLYCGVSFTPCEPASGQRYCLPCGTAKPGSNDRSTSALVDIQQRNTALRELREALKATVANATH